MQIVCLDLEGVLVPEIWIEVANRLNLDALKRTTRDMPDYDELMRYRLNLIGQHGITLQYIQEVIAQLSPLEGARAFLDELRSKFQVVILSDTFYEFATPLMKQLGYPTLLCHKLVVDSKSGLIIDYRLRQQNPKQHSVLAFQQLYYKVMAAGDSFNDVSMLQTADVGAFVHAPESISQQFPEMPAFETYSDLLQFFYVEAEKL